MATTTEHYGMTIPAGSDIVNPLVDTFPNFEIIDGQMFVNENATVGTATEIKTGNVHALTRANGNNNTFRFVATSVFNSGDSFTVDGVSVTCVLPSGESLGDNAYVIGSNVLCILTSTQLTIFTTGGTANNSLALNGQSASYYLNSANSSFDNVGTGLNSTNTEGAIKEVNGRVKANSFGTSVNIISYNSVNNKYTFPSDGYLYVDASAHSGNAIFAGVYGSNESTVITIGGYVTSASLFVKKGMKCYIGTTIGSDLSAYFVPLT